MKMFTFKEILNELDEENKISIKEKIMFSVLSNGFTTNPKYGNPKINYYSFDVRSDRHIMELIYKENSFIETTNKQGKDYRVVGLALNLDSQLRNLKRRTHVQGNVKSN